MNIDIDIENSFRSPFDEADAATGKRLVDEYWIAQGQSLVRENFVRLTPDKQSKRGWVYNVVPVVTTSTITNQDPQLQYSQISWSAFLKFRISGKAKSLYGDGLALWFEQSPENRFMPGFILGHTDEFVGFGILMQDIFTKISHFSLVVLEVQ
jgi:mannose-binding lectin 2